MTRPNEIVYKGHRLGSPLAAKWAVFFDALGIPYEFEKRIFDLDGLKYTPIFWLPGHGVWIEVTENFPSSDDRMKAARLAEGEGKDVIILYGDMMPREDEHGFMQGNGLIFFSDADGSPGEDGRSYCTNAHWVECVTCGRLAVFLVDDGECDHGQPGLSTQPALFEGYALSPRLVAAYQASCQARFQY